MNPYLQALNTPNPLTNLRQTIREHWQKYRPKMVAQLTASGDLERLIETAATLTEEAVFNLTSRGLPLWEAWMQIREEWAILPSEEDVPELGTNPWTGRCPNYRTKTKRRLPHYRGRRHRGGRPQAKIPRQRGAIRLLKQLEAEGRKATPEEQAILVKYVAGAACPKCLTPTKHPVGMPALNGARNTTSYAGY